MHVCLHCDQTVHFIITFFFKKECVSCYLRLIHAAKMRSLIYLVVNLAVSSALSGRRVSKARANCYLFLLAKPLILALLNFKYLICFFLLSNFSFCFHFYTVIHTIYFRSNPETLQCSQILHKQFKQAKSI